MGWQSHHAALSPFEIRVQFLRLVHERLPSCSANWQAFSLGASPALDVDYTAQPPASRLGVPPASIHRLPPCDAATPRRGGHFWVIFGEGLVKSSLYVLAACLPFAACVVEME